jgi:hypothetical protein
MAQLAGVVGRYSNVIYMNDPSDTDLLKTIIGSPRTIVINLGQLLNVASGEVQGDAIAIDEIEATEIAAGAVDTSELADAGVTGVKLDATPSLLETATDVLQDETDGTSTLLAANAAGGGDRLVIVQAECTEAFTITSFEWQVGSSSSANGLFADIFAGLATLGLGETVLGAYLLPEAEDLVLTETQMTAGGGTGTIRFNIIAIAPAAGSITGAMLPDDAVGSWDNITPTTVAFDGGATQELLALDANNDRLVLVKGLCTISAESGVCEWDVGVTAGNEVFDNIAAGAFVVGERFIGSVILPAGSALNVTLQAAGSVGEIDFQVMALTPLVQTAQIADAAVTGVKLANAGVNFPDEITATNAAFDGAAQQELLASDATQDRIVLVTAIVTVSAESGVCDWDVGAVAGNEVFDDLASGLWEVGDRYVGAMLLLQDEALNVNIQTAGSQGAIDFYVTALDITVRTAQIYADAVTDAKIASQIVKDEGARATGVLRVTGVIVDGQNVVIGADTYVADQIDQDSTDTCKNGEWNNTTAEVVIDMNSTDYPQIGVGGIVPLVLGELIYIETEYMRVITIASDNVTFERGACGSTPANHVDTTQIDISAGTEAPGGIPVGHQGAGDLAAGVMTVLIAGAINEDNIPTEDVSAVDVAGDGSELFIVADAVGVVTLALTETHGNAVWDDGNMRRGAAAAVRQIYTAVIDIDTEEATANLVYVPIPFTPAAVIVQVTGGADGVQLQWAGDVIINAAAGAMPAYLELNNDGAVNFANTDEFHILCIS